VGVRKIHRQYRWNDSNNDTNPTKDNLSHRDHTSCSLIPSTVGRIPPVLLQTPPPPTGHGNPLCSPSQLLSLMPSAVVKDDQAVLRAAEEDVLRLGLTELGAKLVVADA
jgi:hypothetical protein